MIQSLSEKSKTAHGDGRCARRNGFSKYPIEHLGQGAGAHK